jgi:hypothetical protein
MATSQAANLVEKRMSHEQKPITEDVPNYSSHGESSQTMKALTWQGKNNVKVGQSELYQSIQILKEISPNILTVDTARPKIIDDTDVIIKVTGSTICGSDLHLYHGISFPALFIKYVFKAADSP